LDSRFRLSLLVSGIARKHGIVPKPFLGRSKYFPPKKEIHFLPRTRDYSRKRVCGFSNRRLQENIFNHANLFGGAILLFPPIKPPKSSIFQKNGVRAERKERKKKLLPPPHNHTSIINHNRVSQHLQIC
jgi:hypothetical protein